MTICLFRLVILLQSLLPDPDALRNATAQMNYKALHLTFFVACMHRWPSGLHVSAFQNCCTQSPMPLSHFYSTDIRAHNPMAGFNIVKSINA